MEERSLTHPAPVDDTTRRVAEMYTRYPYPSHDRNERRLTELANLLRLFSAESRYDFRGKRVLDAGTGTGHRLIAAARLHADTEFVAVDLCEAPLAIAREAAAAAGVSNVSFVQHDLMHDDTDLGRFDVVLCMGVLHHLTDPGAGLARLARLVVDDGLLFAYIYGSLGSAERLRRKEMIALLTASGSFDDGIRMARALSFGTDGFGWTRNADDSASLEALIVDSYLNVNERLFDLDGIADLVRESGFDAFMPYGITTERNGYLFDAAPEARATLAAPWTDLTRVLPDGDARAAYSALGVRDRCRLVELAYQPNGYTVIAYRDAAAHRFTPGGRIERNTLHVGQKLIHHSPSSLESNASPEVMASTISGRRD
ncbi:MAG TPA: class I SAM-dependent methyltransferase [Vicinamibacterales bacterium]